MEWDFGDGTTSTDQSPSHRYTIAGTYTIQLTVSGPGGTDTSVVDGLVTVRPGPPVALEVTPSSAGVAVQQVAQFTAVALDEFGNAVPSEVTWAIAGEGGSIADSGRFTADRVAGTFGDAVKASLQTDAGELVATASVTVEPGPLSSVVVEPVEILLDIGATQPFTFMALDKFGNKITDTLASWSATPEVGAIDANGILIPGTRAGVFLSAVRVDVVKGADKASATADVAVQAGPLASIEVEPSFADVEKGAIQRFAAAAFDQFGNKIRGLAFLWGATGGKITQAGLFTAVEQGGSYEVRASASVGEREATGSATVHIPSSLDLYLHLGSLAEEAHAFAEPILAAISGVPPDFQDDFSTADKRWRWNLNNLSDQGIMQIQNGVMRVSGLIGRVIISAGPISPSKDFVLEVDIRIAQGDLMSQQKVFFHSDGRIYYSVEMRSAAQSWRLSKRLLDQSSTIAEGTGEVNAIGETTQFRAIVRGDQGVVYLDGQPIVYLNDADLGLLAGAIQFHCLSSAEGVCEFDNVKFWNLANVPNLP